MWTSQNRQRAQTEASGQTDRQEKREDRKKREDGEECGVCERGVLASNAAVAMMLGWGRAGLGPVCGCIVVLVLRAGAGHSLCHALDADGAPDVIASTVAAAAAAAAAAAGDADVRH